MDGRIVFWTKSIVYFVHTWEQLKTLWPQPRVDEEKVHKLASGITELETELMNKRDKYLMQCRRELGDQGWCCPGGRW